MMDAKRIAELRALCEKATTGPWRVYADEERVDGIYGPPRIVDYGSGPERDDVQIVETDSGYYPPSLQDAAFIATARTALPEALDEIERLRKALAEACDIASRKRRVKTQVADNYYQVTDVGLDRDEEIRIAQLRKDQP